VSVSLNRKVAAYVAIRDKMQALAFEHKNALAELGLRQDGLEQQILAELDELGITGAVTVEAGRVERRVSTRAVIENEDEFFDWIHQKVKSWTPGEQDPLHYLERRVAQKRTKDHIEDVGVPPPGVGTVRKQSLRIVKSKG